jgi:hypothetical protein
MPLHYFGAFNGLVVNANENFLLFYVGERDSKLTKQLWCDPLATTSTYQIMLESTGQTPKTEPPAKNPAAVELGRLGGLKGGLARAAKLSPKKRSQIAAKAATARWRKKRAE